LAKHTAFMAAATAALLVGGLSGLAAGKAPAAKPVVKHKVVTVTLGGWAAYADNNVKQMNNFLKPFEKEYPWIHVQYQPVAGDYETVLKTEYVAGDAADVVALNNGGQASPFIDAGDVIPLNSYLAASHESVNDFYQGSSSLFTYTARGSNFRFFPKASE